MGLWVYDLRVDQRPTLRKRPLNRADLDDFVTCYGSKYGRRHRQRTERFQGYGYEKLVKRDNLNLDLFRLKDASAPI